MKDKIDLMDKAIKEKFAHHEVPVPSNLWNSIESKLPVEVNPISTLSFFKNPFALSFLIVSTIIVGVYVYQASSSKKRESNITNIHTEQKKTTQISASSLNKINVTVTNNSANKSSISNSETASPNLLNNSTNASIAYKNKDLYSINTKLSTQISSEYLNTKNATTSHKKNLEPTTISKQNVANTKSGKTKQHINYSSRKDSTSINNAASLNKNLTQSENTNVQDANASINLNDPTSNNSSTSKNKIQRTAYTDSTGQDNSNLNNTTSILSFNDTPINNGKVLTQSKTNYNDTSNSVINTERITNQISRNTGFNEKSAVDTTELNYSRDSNTLKTSTNNTTYLQDTYKYSDSTTYETPSPIHKDVVSDINTTSTNTISDLAFTKTIRIDSSNSLSNTDISIHQIAPTGIMNHKSFMDTTAFTTDVNENEINSMLSSNQVLSSNGEKKTILSNIIKLDSTNSENYTNSVMLRNSEMITGTDSLLLTNNKTNEENFKIDSTRMLKEIDSTSLANATKKADELKNEEKKKSSFLSRCSIDGYATPSLAHINLAPNSNLEGQTNFINERKTKPGFGITTGLRMNYRLSKKIEVGIGLQYSSVNQQASFTKRQLDSTTNTYQGYIRIDSTYDSISHTTTYKNSFIITDTTTNPVYSNRIVKHIDKFQNISIPIHIAYGYSISEKFSLIARTSLLINFQTYSVTYLKESDSTIVSHHTSRNISLGGSFSIGGYYLLSPRCTAFIEPIVTYYFSNGFDKQAPFKQTQYQLGLQTGIRISF